MNRGVLHVSTRGCLAPNHLQTDDNRTRDFAAEYARRIANAMARGLSRSQARGHPKPAEISVRAVQGGRSIEDFRLQLGLKVLRQKKVLRQQLMKFGSRRSDFVAMPSKNLIEKQGRRWLVRHDLPRRMLVYSQDRPYHGRRRFRVQPPRLAASCRPSAAFWKPMIARSSTRSSAESVRDDLPARSIRSRRDPTSSTGCPSAGEHTFEQVYRIVI